MGLAIEPDPADARRAFAWDDVVSVFPATEELSNDIASYHAATILLELGMTIAAADGHVDEIELGRLKSDLESQFELSSQDSIRLAHLRYLLTRRPAQECAAARTLREKLSVEQLRAVGEFLVGIAAADQQIAPQEVKALEKAYRLLGLDHADLHRLLQSVEGNSANITTGSPTTTAFQIDMALVEAKRADTAKLKIILEGIFREDYESDGAAEARGQDSELSEKHSKRPSRPQSKQAECRRTRRLRLGSKAYTIGSLRLRSPRLNATFGLGPILTALDANMG